MNFYESMSAIAADLPGNILGEIASDLIESAVRPLKDRAVVAYKRYKHYGSAVAKEFAAFSKLPHAKEFLDDLAATLPLPRKVLYSWRKGSAKKLTAAALGDLGGQSLKAWSDGLLQSARAGKYPELEKPFGELLGVIEAAAADYWRSLLDSRSDAIVHLVARTVEVQNATLKDEITAEIRDCLFLKTESEAPMSAKKALKTQILTCENCNAPISLKKLERAQLRGMWECVCEACGAPLVFGQFTPEGEAWSENCKKQLDVILADLRDCKQKLDRTLSGIEELKHDVHAEGEQTRGKIDESTATILDAIGGLGGAGQSETIEDRRIRKMEKRRLLEEERKLREEELAAERAKEQAQKEAQKKAKKQERENNRRTKSKRRTAAFRKFKSYFARGGKGVCAVSILLSVIEFAGLLLLLSLPYAVHIVSDSPDYAAYFAVTILLAGLTAVHLVTQAMGADAYDFRALGFSVGLEGALAAVCILIGWFSGNMRAWLWVDFSFGLLMAFIIAGCCCDWEFADSDGVRACAFSLFGLCIFGALCGWLLVAQNFNDGYEGGFYYEVETDGTATVYTYAYTMSEVTYPTEIGGRRVTGIGAPVKEGGNKLQSAVIPDGIGEIGDGTFRNCSFLSEVKMSDSVWTIGAHAFENCSRLSALELPAELLSLGNAAMKNCTALTAIALPDSVNALGDEVFSGCTLLKEVRLSAALERLPTASFRNCSALTEISIPDRVAVIGAFAFVGCSRLKQVTLPEGSVWQVYEWFSRKDRFSWDTEQEKIVKYLVGLNEWTDESPEYLKKGT